VVAHMDEGDIDVFDWVNPQRLVFNLVDRKLAAGDLRFQGAAVFAINKDGSKQKQLVDAVGNADPAIYHGLLPYGTRLGSVTTMRDSDEIFMYRYHRDKGLSLSQVNSQTREVVELDVPDDMSDWLLDQNGKLRIAMSSRDDVDTIWYLDPASKRWRALARFASHGNTRDAFDPLYFGPDGQFYVSAWRGGDKRAVYTYDLANNTLSDKAVINVAGYDFVGDAVSDASKLLGLRFRTDDQNTHWFDAGMAQVQAAVDALLPATVNAISPAARAGLAAPFVLVKSHSDTQPMVYLLYNTSTKKLTRVGKSMPDLKSADMGPRSLVHYKARDGMDIPAYLTLPPGSEGKQLPTILLVHGGPYVHGPTLAWNPQVALLASRGYAVLEPAFRGTTGYGLRHFKAGWKQWGLAMQDDIADGAAWAVAQGIAAPKRICIAGASYGGYATLMGLVNNPELFQCGVEWIGVTDLGQLFKEHWLYRSDADDELRKYGLPAIIGDPVADAARFKATSPLAQAARITQPLLLAYGGADMRVPLVHGTTFYNAVKATNKQVEWIEYSNEGHGWALPKNQIDFWTRVEKFLDRHIGSGVAAKP
jgi:dipeptidyl aminopeptidase/acylaminoacyl peptidase